MAEAKTARVAAEVVRGAARVLEGARAEVTKRLITERGFTTVAVEADWPDAYRVNRYVRGESEDADARTALGGFTTHRGTVTASGDWDEPGRRRRVRPALEGSYEALFYFHAQLAEQFDAVLHFDETTAVALEPGAQWHAGDEPPETYPSGI